MDDIKLIVMQAVKDAIKLHNNSPYNIQEAGDYLRLSQSKMYELLPYIPHSIVGGKRLFIKADLDAYIKENRVEGRP